MFFLTLCMCTVRNMRCVYWADVTIWRIRTNFWKLDPCWPTELRRDHRGHESSLFRNVEESLWAAMEYLQNASKWIQGQFYKHWTANYLRLLNDAILARLNSSSVRITITKWRYDVCLRIDVTFERIARLDTVDVKYIRFSNIASANAIR